MEKRYFHEGVVTISLHNLALIASKSISFRVDHNDTQDEGYFLERLRKNNYDTIVGANDAQEFWSGVIPRTTEMIVSHSFEGTQIALLETMQDEIRSMCKDLGVKIVFFGDSITEVEEQDFDYTAESFEENDEIWQRALAKIPLPEKSYSTDSDFDLLGDKLQQVGLRFLVTHEFFGVDDDVWSSLRFLFKEGNRVELDISSNYSMRDEDEIRTMVNAFLQAHDIKMSLDGRTEDYRNLTWQEAYDLLCLISRRKYVIPKGSFVEWDEEA